MFLDEGQPSLVEFPRERTIEFLSEAPSLGRRRRVQRKLLSAFVVLQMPTTQNDQYTTVAYFEVTCSASDLCVIYVRI